MSQNLSRGSDTLEQKRTFFMCLIVGLLASPFTVSIGLAESSALGEAVPSSVEARMKANQYSFDRGGIGLLIAYGSGNKVSADEIGTAFVNEIKQRGEKARYFYYQADWPGVAIEYYIGYSALGPWDTDTAAANVSKAIARMKAARKVHNQ